MEILECGQIVVMKISKQQGMIIGVKIEFTSIKYTIHLYNDSKYEEISAFEQEFTISDGEKLKIGYRSNRGNL